MKNLLESAEAFQRKLLADANGRFLSWEHCYGAFAAARVARRKGALPDYDNLALHLAFYLASWGMYRGSSFLLQKDYRVHCRAVEIILESQYDVLQGISLADAERDLTAEESFIMGLYNRLKKEYNAKRDSIPEYAEKHFGGASATLITKIMLGTLGCVPAYDQYFCKGLAKMTAKVKAPKSFSERSLRCVVSYVREHEKEFEHFRKGRQMRMTLGGNPYPPMKLIDMAFWKLGCPSGKMAY